MGLFSKLKEAKGSIKAISAVNQNPLKYEVVTAIENGKDEPDFNMLQAICMQSHNDYGRVMIMQAIDEYFMYKGNDWQRINNWIITCANIVVLGSEMVVKDMRARKLKFEAYLKHSNPKVAKEADNLLYLLVDDAYLQKMRSENNVQGGVLIGGGQVKVFQ